MTRQTHQLMASMALVMVLVYCARSVVAPEMDAQVAAVYGLLACAVLAVVMTAAPPPRRPRDELLLPSAAAAEPWAHWSAPPAPMSAKFAPHAAVRAVRAPAALQLRQPGAGLGPAPRSMALEAATVGVSNEMATAGPAPVVLSPLPKLYVYDHCPFCVRVRVALGVKNVKHQLVFLMNDDVETPTGLVGKKMAPIYEGPGAKPMPESLDIIEAVDADPAYGTVGAIKPGTGRADLKAWQKSVQTTMRLLCRPRYMRAYLPEFATQDSRSAFVKNHQIPPAEKKDWKADSFPGGMEARWAGYDEAMAMTGVELPKMNAALLELEALIHAPECVTEGGVSYDDIDMWSRLRSLTIIKGIEFPPKVAAYLNHFSVVADVPLYTDMAL